MKRGVVVGSDAHMEWLLPWWWERYSSSNKLPVFFVDLGMTEKAKLWCADKGEVFTLDPEKEKKSIKGTLVKEWIDIYGSSYERARNAWFKKPAACMATPFDETVWIDLDCEVLSSIEPIFSCLSEGKELAAALDRIPAIPEGFVPSKYEGLELFNGGVIVFKKESALIKEWAKIALEEPHLYWGDDHVLSTVIGRYPENVAVISPIYNWRMANGAPFYAKIIHWCGEWGKTFIAKKGGIKETLEGLPELKNVFDTC